MELSRSGLTIDVDGGGLQKVDQLETHWKTYVQLLKIFQCGGGANVGFLWWLVFQRDYF